MLIKAQRNIEQLLQDLHTGHFPALQSSNLSSLNEDTSDDNQGDDENEFS